jgi:hypothetical protein
LRDIVVHYGAKSNPVKLSAISHQKRPLCLIRWKHEFDLQVGQDDVFGTAELRRNRS